MTIDCPSPTTSASVPAQRADLLHDLAESLRGEVGLPGSETYERLTAAFNVAVDVRPLAVVAAADAYDVARAVTLAARHGVRVGVQCTGHGAEATMRDALLVHTGALDECVVHAEGWARVGAGVRWRTVMDAAAEFGLTPLVGSSPGVGVVGYTTGGGLGPMARTFGLASDRVRAFDVVTGTGRLVRATPTQHADLFWGLRGGRGSLGIVTAIEFDLVPLERVYGGAIFFDTPDVANVLHTWSTWVQTLPEAATSSLAVMQLPPLPHVPPPLAGKLTVAVRFVFTDDPAEGERLLAPLRAVAKPLLDGVAVLPCTAMDTVHRDPVDPVPVQQAAGLLRELPAEAVEALLRMAGPESQSPLAVVELRHLGGAVSRPGRHDSAVCGRDAGFHLMALGLAVPPVSDAVEVRLAELLDALAPWSTGGTLPNFCGGPSAYDAQTLERLRSLVLTHDPARVLLAADALAPTT